jgi:cytosine deaminase
VIISMEAGVKVCIGHDSVIDPWYPLGYGDPLQAAFVLLHLRCLATRSCAGSEKLFQRKSPSPVDEISVDGISEADLRWPS